MTKEEAHTANKGFAVAGGACFVDTFVQGGSSVLRVKFSAKTPRHRNILLRSALRTTRNFQNLENLRPVVINFK